MEEKLAAYRRNRELKAKEVKEVQNQDITKNLPEGDKSAKPQLNINYGKNNSSKNASILSKETIDKKDFTFRESLPHSGFDWVVLLLKVCLWLSLFFAAKSVGFGAVYFVVSLSFLIYRSMRTGSRKSHELSAYSVFNDNCERIGGTFTAEQFESQLRTGSLR